MVIIAKGQKRNFEKVALDEFIIGEIVDVQERKGIKREYKNKETGEIDIRETDQVRFVFKLEGYEFNHYSRWNNLSTNSQSNLYIKYIVPLFGNKYPPDSCLDIERLRGLKVKVRWDETPMKNSDEMFQFVDKIRLFNPNDAKNINLFIEELDASTEEKEMQQAMNEIEDEPTEQQVPF